MANDQRKNMILGGAALVLVVAAVVLLFRDSLFPAKAPDGSAVDQSAVDNVIKASGGGSGQPEPSDPNPPPRGSGKLKAK